MSNNLVRCQMSDVHLVFALYCSLRRYYQAPTRYVPINLFNALHHTIFLPDTTPRAIISLPFRYFSFCEERND